MASHFVSAAACRADSQSLKRRLALVTGDLVIGQRRADDLAMAQIVRHHAVRLSEIVRRKSWRKNI